MPKRIPRPCRYPGCPAIAQDDSPYCPEHERQTRRDYDRQRGSAASRGYDRRWRKAREWFLRRNPLCVECLRNGILTPATVVDHVIPHRGDPTLFWDQTNWQALCKPCHDRKTALEDGRWSARSTVVTIVCGPPGSGKTTYVRERARPGDLIDDLDAIFAAISGLPWYHKPPELLPFAAEARDAILRRLERPSCVERAWVITSGAKRQEREALAQRLKARVVVLTVPPEECLRRIRQDERRAHQADQWETLVRRWWEEYEP